jgi:hypothetical protein
MILRGKERRLFGRFQSMLVSESSERMTLIFVTVYDFDFAFNNASAMSLIAD